MGINKYRDLNLKIVKSNGKIQYAGIIIDSPNSTVISENLGGTVSIILNSNEVNSFHITASTSSSSGGRVQFYKNQNFLFVTKLWLENLCKKNIKVYKLPIYFENLSFKSGNQNVYITPSDYISNFTEILGVTYTTGSTATVNSIKVHIRSYTNEQIWLQGYNGRSDQSVSTTLSIFYF